MGMFDWLTNVHRMAEVLLLGFALVVFVCMAYLAGRSRHRYYDADHPWGPIENHAGWLREGHGPIPFLLWFWTIAVLAWMFTITGVVMWHGYYY